MSKIVQSISVMLLICLIGCALGPDYKRPEQSLLDYYRHDDGMTPVSDAESLAARKWRDVYHDEQLQLLIETGLANNLDLAIAKSRVREARSLIGIARSPIFPQLDHSFSGEREQDPGVTTTLESPDQESVITKTVRGSPENTFNFQGLLSWELDLWGEIRRSVEAAKAEWLASEANREAREVSLIGEIATAYFELLDISDRLKISERTVSLRKEALRIAQLRRKAGVISDLEVRQAEVELHSTRVVIPSLRAQRRVKENQLRVLLGQVPGDIRQGLSLSAQPLPPTLPVGLPSSLLQRRPDIRLAEFKLVASNALIGVAIAQFFPKIRLTGAFGRESDELGMMMTSYGKTWVIAYEALTPVFRGGRNVAQYKVARERFEQEKLSYREVVLRALQEVSDALEGYLRTEEALETRQSLVNSSREYSRLAWLRYYNGVLDYLDVLDSQRQLFDAELSLSEAKRNRLVEFVRIYKALGGGWQE
jgi:NodT family efflux transporter outer membrane factor (OMF) lipoprotein